MRKQVCDWIEQHKERYEGFVEDDDYLVEDVGGKAAKKGGVRDKGKGLEAHLRCMRENGTFLFSLLHFAWSFSLALVLLSLTAKRPAAALVPYSYLTSNLNTNH